jgi:hypothetical protein
MQPRMIDDWPMPDHDSGDSEDDNIPEPRTGIPPCPPPEVWEFYRTHGRWPGPLEA